MCSNEGEQAIFCYSTVGPCFGGDGNCIRDMGMG